MLRQHIVIEICSYIFPSKLPSCWMFVENDQRYWWALYGMYYDEYDARKTHHAPIWRALFEREQGLEELLEWQPIKKMNICKKKLHKLKLLNLEYNNLTCLPDSIGFLVNLKQLDLSENKLTYLPDSIGNLVNLQRLDLSYNNLTCLPDSIGNLVNLQGLFLGENELTCLPDSIGNLVNLQKLILGDNKLTCLPDSIGNLINLQQIYLYSNKLTNLPDILKDKLENNGTTIIM